MSILKNDPIYLDYASTTPVDPRVLDAMLPYFTEQFGNASSKDHIYGDIAKKAVYKAREQVASLIHAEPNEIIFTSGATEAINLGLLGFYQANKHKGKHLITVSTEHKAVLETMKYLEQIGAEVTILEVDKNGLIDLKHLEQSIRDDTILAAVMFVNNETGVIQDIQSIAQLCRSRNVSHFCDASQAAGKLGIELSKLEVDLLAISGHKFHAPKGIGALFIRHGVTIDSIIHGGGQEYGLRSGTNNTPLVVGLGKACEISSQRMHTDYKLVRDLENIFLKNVLLNDKIILNGDKLNKSPYIMNIQFKEKSANEIKMQFRNQFCISTGSACNSEIEMPSHVLLGLGLSSEQANNSIRISISRDTSKQRLINVAKSLVNR